MSSPSSLPSTCRQPPQLSRQLSQGLDQDCKQSEDSGSEFNKQPIDQNTTETKSPARNTDGLRQRSVQGKDAGHVGQADRQKEFESVNYSRRAQGREQEWEAALRKVKGYSPVYVLLMSLTVQTAVTALACCLFGSFVTQTTWFGSRKPEGSSQSLFTLKEAKEAVLHEFRDQFYLLQKRIADGETTSEKEKTTLKEFYEEELRKQASNLTTFYQEKLQLTNQTIQKQFDAVTKQCEANISSVNSSMLQSLDVAKSDLAVKQSELAEDLKQQPQILEIKGFMNIETFGPILLVVAIVEIVLVFGLCSICCSTGWRRSHMTLLQPQVNGQVMQGAGQSPPLAQINTNNSTLAVVCFRDSDEDRCEKWAETIIASLIQKPQLTAHVVNSVNDIASIPACRVALVFVDPDEREMIIEDERHHIGQGLRRQAVQRLMDSNVMVFVVIFNDKNSEKITGTNLFNKELRQIYDHRQLKQLKADKRIISIKSDFLPHQKQHIVKELQRQFVS